MGDWLRPKPKPPAPEPCRMTVNIFPAGAPSQLVIDAAPQDPSHQQVWHRVSLTAIPGDGRQEVYEIPPRYTGWFANLEVYADGWVSHIERFQLRAGADILLPDVRLQRAKIGPPIYGNFLATPRFELGLGQMPILFLLGMPRDQRQRAYDAYRAHGYRTFPCHYRQFYRQWGYDYTNQLGQYEELLEEAISFGLEPLIAVMNWHPGEPMPTRDTAKREIDRTLPPLLDLSKRFFYAWEQTDHPLGWSEDTLDLSRHIRGILGPERELYTHNAPDYWSPNPFKVDSMDEWHFWSEVSRIEREEMSGRTLLDGLLLQLHPGDTVEADRHKLFEYENNPARAQGYVGRVIEHFHRKMALFEFARTFPEWELRQSAVEAHPKAALLEGYC